MPTPARKMPSRAKLLFRTTHPFGRLDRKADSVEKLIKEVFEIEYGRDEVIYYRGHADLSFKLMPSVFRNRGWANSENQLFSELIASNPKEFHSDGSAFEKLVTMQHHSLPTRLLDITSNPLMALYFACDTLHNDDGEVIFLKIKKDKIKYFDSDAVSALSNLTRLSSKERADIDTSLDRKKFNNTDPIPRLIHFIKEEKSYFTNWIDPADLDKIFCVKTKMSNDRILSQSGAFLLFGLVRELLDTTDGESDSPQSIEIQRVLIPAISKQKILNELSQLNISHSTVYPNIDNSAGVIKAKYFIRPRVRARLRE